MKKLALTALVVLALSPAAFAQTTAATPAATTPPAMIAGNVKPATVVVVDIGYVFDHYTLAQAMNLQFSGAFSDANQTFAVMVNELQGIVKSANDINDKMTATGTSEADKAALNKELDAKKQEFQAKQTQLGTYKSNKERDLSDTRLSITQSLIRNIQDVVKEVAKKHNAAFVLNSNGIGSVLFASPDYDATAEVLEALNSANPAPAPAPAAASASAKPATTSGTSAAPKPATTSGSAKPSAASATK